MTARQQHFTWLAFVALVVALIGILAFLPHATVQRAADALSVVGTLLLAGAIGHWLLRRRQAGKTLTILEPLPGTGIVILALFVGLIGVAGDTIPRDLFVVVTAWAAFGAAQIVGRLRARERGLTRGSHVLPWADIVSYGWDEPAAHPDMPRWAVAPQLAVRYRAGGGRRLRTLSIRCTPEAQAALERILARHASRGDAA